MDIVLKLDPTQADYDAVMDPLAAFNDIASDRPHQYKRFIFHLLDPASGKPVGGIGGWTNHDWVYIVVLFVPEELRGKGVGRELINRAEAFAREEGMIGMWLDTFDFQARGFYEKLGFEVFGTIEDHPVGGRRYFLHKRFVAPTA